MILLAEEKTNPAKDKEYNSSAEEDSLSESETSDEEDSVNNKNKIVVDPCDKIESTWRFLCLSHLETYVEGKVVYCDLIGEKNKEFVHWKGFASIPG